MEEQLGGTFRIFSGNRLIQGIFRSGSSRWRRRSRVALCTSPRPTSLWPCGCGTRCSPPSARPRPLPWATARGGGGGRPERQQRGSGELPVAPVRRPLPAWPPEPGFSWGCPSPWARGDRPKRQWRFSFDDFVVGPCNELAYAAAQGLCRDTLASDRIFLSSSSGLGKTHLLQALGCALSGLGQRALRPGGVPYRRGVRHANGHRP